MKVVLLEDIKKLGEKGDIIEIHNGYAMNFLIPNKKAVDCSSVSGKNIRTEKDKKIDKKTTEIESLMEEFLKISDVINLKVKTNEKGHLYDSITPSKLVNFLKEDQIDAQKDWFDFENIKEIGEYEIKALYKNKKRNIKLNVNN